MQRSPSASSIDPVHSAAAPSIWFAGGGSGGHLQPLQALRSELRARRPSWSLPLFVSGRVVERPFLGSDREVVPLFPGNRSRPALHDSKAWWQAVRRVRALCRDRRPDLVVMGGGYVALVVAAACSSLPWIQLEPDCKPGKVSRLLRLRARRVFTQWPLSESSTASRRNSSRFEASGMPLVQSVFPPKAEARRRLGINGAARVLGVVGGSQGASALDRRLLAGALDLGVVQNLEILHIAGEARVEALEGAYRHCGVRAQVRSFVKDMATWYAAVDLVVARAGGMTVAEVAAAGRAALFVPYPHHRDRHQEMNADVLVRAGAAWCVREDRCTMDGFVRDEIVPRLLAGAQLEQRGLRAAELARLEGTQRIADWVEGAVCSGDLDRRARAIDCSVSGPSTVSSVGAAIRVEQPGTQGEAEHGRGEGSGAARAAPGGIGRQRDELAGGPAPLAGGSGLRQ